MNMRHSIRGRLIATVVLSQALLAAGMVFAGVYYTNRRLLTMLEAGMQARAVSLAALVRYSEDDSGNVYFDKTLTPQSLDPSHPDLFEVWTNKSGMLAQSVNWPSELQIDLGGDRYWDFTWHGTPYRGLRASH